MAPEELNKLGYRDGAASSPATSSSAADRAKLAIDGTQQERARKGFIAGLPPPKT